MYDVLQISQGSIPLPIQQADWHVSMKVLKFEPSVFTWSNHTMDTPLLDYGRKTQIWDDKEFSISFLS